MLSTVGERDAYSSRDSRKDIARTSQTCRNVSRVCRKVGARPSQRHRATYRQCPSRPPYKPVYARAAHLYTTRKREQRQQRQGHKQQRNRERGEQTVLQGLCLLFPCLRFIIIIINLYSTEMNLRCMDLNMNEILVNDCTDGLKVTNQQPYQRDKKKNLKHKT